MIYLDNAASSPLHECVDRNFHLGNAGSRTHAIGLQLKKQVEEARENCADLLNIKPEQIIFTSGATESLMILVQGLKRSGYHNWCVASTEHKAALNQVKDVQPNATILDVSRNGIVQIERSTGSDVAVCMSVNNETGVINKPWNKLKSNGIKFTIADCTQSVGKIDLDLSKDGIDFLAGSAHKFHGPTGCGFIAVQDVDLWDMLKSPSVGGGQERGVRSGTLNASSIIQTGQVASWISKNKDIYRSHLLAMQSIFEQRISENTNVQVIGGSVERASHISSLYFPEVDNEALISAVNHKLAISSGSACTSHSIEPSHVLLAMEDDIEKAESIVRISYGWQTTELEVKKAADLISEAVQNIRSFFH